MSTESNRFGRLSTRRSWSLMLPLSECRICIYREGEAPAEPKPSSAGASLSHVKKRRVDFSLPLALAGLLFLIGGQFLHSAPPEIVCSVIEEEDIFVGESLTYQVNIQNADSPSTPNIAGLNEQFAVEFLGDQSRNQSSTMIINGRISQTNTLSHVYQYRLTPKLAGTLTIPEVTATVDGKKLTSNSLSVRVLDIPKQDTVVAEIVPSPRKVYPTQSFSVRLRIMVQPIADTREDPLKPLRRSPPRLQINWLKTLEGLETNEVSDWLQPLLSTNNVGFTINEVNADSFLRTRLAVFDLSKGREKRNGLAGIPIDYFVYELDRKFVAEKPGTYTFGPASVKGTFATGFSGREYNATRIVTIASAINMEVLEVPSPRPNNFIGGIGNYAVSVVATPTKLRVGDPMTLTLQITQREGSGSLKLISAPDLTAMPEIADQFDIVDKNPVGRQENSSKKFAFALRPKRAGVSIPALSLSTFDPTSEGFSNIRTDPIAIEVMEASTIGGGDLIGAIGSAKPGTDIKTRADGIFHNVTDVSQLRDERMDLMDGLKWVAALWMGTGIAITTLFVFRRQSADVPRQRRVSARRTAQSRLTAAKSLLKQGKQRESLREVRAAILGLVADTGNRIADGLTTADVNDAIQAAAVPSEDQQKLKRLLERIESAEYGATDATDSTQLVKDASELVDRVSPFLVRRFTR